MNVRELKVALSELDENLMLVVSGYEGGVTEVERIAPVKLLLNAHEAWYYGEHEVDNEDGDAKAICIVGNRH